MKNVVLCVAFLCVGSVFSQTTVQVNERTPVYIDPTINSEVHGDLLEGTFVIITDTLDNFYRAKTGYGYGYIKKGAVNGTAEHKLDVVPDDVAYLERYGMFSDPAVAIRYSWIIPGGGQIYSGEHERGLTMLSLANGALWLGYILTMNSEKYEIQDDFTIVDRANYLPVISGAAIYIGVWGYSIVNAAKSAKRMNQKRLNYRFSASAHTAKLRLDYNF